MGMKPSNWQSALSLRTASGIAHRKGQHDERRRQEARAALGFMDDETLDAVIETTQQSRHTERAITFTEAMFIEEYLSNGFSHKRRCRP